jgi:hypothetical protein
MSNRIQPLVIALALALAPACSSDFEDFEEEEPEPGVEPAIVYIAPKSPQTGTAVLTLYLHPEASSSAEVWLFGLNEFSSNQVSSIESEVPFPIELEPGDFVRTRFSYVMSGHDSSCEHKLTGTIFDSLSDELTNVFSAAAEVPGCH